MAAALETLRKNLPVQSVAKVQGLQEIRTWCHTSKDEECEKTKVIQPVG